MITLQTILSEIQDDQTAEKLANEIGMDLDNIFQKELEKASQQQNEAILTTAAITLAIPGLLNTIAKVAQAFSKKFLKGIDLKKQDPKVWYAVLEKFTDNIDSYIGRPFDTILKPIIQDVTTRKKVVNLLKGLALASMAIAGGITLTSSDKVAIAIKSFAGGFSQEILQNIGQKQLPDLITFAKKAIATYL